MQDYKPVIYAITSFRVKSKVREHKNEGTRKEILFQGYLNLLLFFEKEKNPCPERSPAGPFFSLTRVRDIPRVQSQGTSLPPAEHNPT